MAISTEAIDAADERVTLMRRSLKRIKFRLEELTANCDSALGEVENLDDSLSRVRETEAYGDGDEDRVAVFNNLLKLLDASVDDLAERADEAVSLDDNLEANRYVLNNIASGVAELE